MWVGAARIRGRAGEGRRKRIFVTFKRETLCLFIRDLGRGSRVKSDELKIERKRLKLTDVFDSCTSSAEISRRDPVVFSFDPGTLASPQQRTIYNTHTHTPLVCRARYDESFVYVRTAVCVEQILCYVDGNVELRVRGPNGPGGKDGISRKFCATEVCGACAVGPQTRKPPAGEAGCSRHGGRQLIRWPSGKGFRDRYGV